MFIDRVYAYIYEAEVFNNYYQFMVSIHDGFSKF